MSVPFNESELDIIKQSLALLHEINYFNRLADEQLERLANSFESTADSEKLIAVAKVTAARNAFLGLAQESARAAQAVEDSETQENQNEIDVA